MASSLSNLVNILSEGIHKIKWRLYEHDDKKCETFRIKHKDCECLLEYTKFNENLIEQNACVVRKIIKNVWWNPKKRELLIHANYLTILVSFFYCCKKAFTHTIYWWLKKNQ